MLALRGLALLLLCQAIGESVTHALSLPFPGPVVGLLLMLPMLRLAVVREPISGHPRRRYLRSPTLKDGFAGVGYVVTGALASLSGRSAATGPG